MSDASTIKSLLSALVDVPAPPGHEHSLRAYVKSAIEPYADQVYVDALGNLIARKGKKAQGGRRILLAAHLDQIALIVSHVDEQGFVRFTTLGGVPVHRLVGARVRFLSGHRGVIALEREVEPKERAPKVEKFFIDVGAENRKNAPVRVGDVAVLEADFRDLGQRVLSPCLDDRIGVTLLIDHLCRADTGPNEVYYAFTVQEEVGTRGAGPAAYSIEPEIALAVDVTLAGDTPQAGVRNLVRLGGGPAIKVKDAGMICDPAVVERMKSLAEKERIPHQFELLEGGSTDARAIQISGAGVQSGGLSIPTRYIHTPSEMIDMRDVEQAHHLLALFCASRF